METQTITLTLPVEALRRAELIAARRHISLSEMVTGLLEGLAAKTGEYEQARQRHLAILEQGFEMGTQGQIQRTREELHAR